VITRGNNKLDRAFQTKIRGPWTFQKPGATSRITNSGGRDCETWSFYLVSIGGRQGENGRPILLGTTARKQLNFHKTLLGGGVNILKERRRGKSNENGGQTPNAQGVHETLTTPENRIRGNQSPLRSLGGEKREKL